MRKIKCGVVGLGYLGQHHARIYNELDGCELVGIFELNATRAKEISDQYNCKIFDSLDSIAESCDAISVVVPTDKHCEVAVPLLEKRVHLLIEKPLCEDLEEAQKILEAARKNNCVVQVGHIEHFNPVMEFLEDMVNKPRFITADRLAPFNPRGTEVGVVLDLMIHDIGIILQLNPSPIEKIESVGVRVLSSTEDIANARITFSNGCVANLNTSRVSLKKVREVRVFQQGGYLSLDFNNQKGHFLSTEGQQIKKEEIPINKGEPLALELLHFTECLRDSESTPKVGGEFGRNALEVALKITEQIRSSPDF